MSVVLHKNKYFVPQLVASNLLPLLNIHSMTNNEELSPDFGPVHVKAFVHTECTHFFSRLSIQICTVCV